MRQLVGFVTTALAVVSIAFTAGGCGCGHGNSDDGLTSQQQTTSDRFSDIMRTTGGDWNKLTPDDKKFVISLTNGNEQAAQMMFTMRSQRMNPGGGGPRSGPGR